MRWEDEQYVRFYRRNTPEWLALSWQARGLFGLIMREVDRAGIIKVGKIGLRGVAVVLHAPWAEIEAPLGELIADGCITYAETKAALFIPNFLPAQEAAQSDTARKRKSREMARATFPAASDERAATVTNRDPMASQNVTKSHVTSHSVTSGHSELSDLSLADLSFALKTQEQPAQLALTAEPAEVQPLARPVFDFEGAYSRYPRKLGKAAGLKRCKALIKTP
jgi:hypothetical protein